MGARLRLLGGFELRDREGTLVAVSASRVQAFLGWTALNGGRHDRGRLAELFWPEVPDAQARNNLRQLLHQVRRAWPAHGRDLHTDEATVEWAEDVRVDVLEFERDFARAQEAWQRGDRASARTALMAATASYGGPLLPGAAGEWIPARREQLQRRCVQALDLLARLHEERREFADAITAARRMIEVDALGERGHLRLMRLHALDGDRASALRVYERWVLVSRQELNAPPSPEMSDAAARIAARTATQTSRAADEAPRATPLVGRDVEWRRLLAAWDRAQAGEPAITLLVGEAGVGKSRIAEEMIAWADAQGLAVARARAYEAEGRLALGPVAEWLRSAAIRPVLDRLDAPWRIECARLLPELVSDGHIAGPDPLVDFPQRQRFFDALVRALTSGLPALILVLDDLQWCDAETLEFLHYLLRGGTACRLLLIGTARDDETGADHPLVRFQRSLRASSALEEILVAPLDGAETARLAASVAGRSIATGEAVRLYQDTRGNPLFIVETIRAGGVPADAAESAVALPHKVQAVITGRLHQLSKDARELAGLAAAVGRSFDADLLAEASAFDDHRMVHALDELWQRKILREASPHETSVAAYDFSHDRLRDVAYATLGPAQRRQWHLRLAACLERRATARPGALAAQLAAQYDRAGQPARALAHYESAAGEAQRLFAYEESRSLLERLLALVPSEPDPRERAARELRAQLMLATAIRVTRGWAAPELEPVHARVVTLSQEVGTLEQRAAALAAAMFFSEVRAEYDRVAALTADMKRAAEDADLPFLKVMAATAELGSLMLRGEFEASEAVFTASEGWYDTGQHAAHVALTGADFGVLRSAWSSHSLWLLGDASGAFARLDEALQLARSLSHPFSEALALSYLAMLHQLAGDAADCERLARDALDTSTRARVSYYAAWAGILLAWNAAVREPSTAAALAVHDRIGEFLATGAGARLSYYLSLAADARYRAGDAIGALADLDRALKVSNLQGDAWFDAELHRARAAALAQLGRFDDAFTAATRARDVAHAQRSRTFEARAEATRAWLEANAPANG